MQFSIEEVLKVFLELDSSKGPGPDGVPPNILKNCASAFATPLTCIFNKYLASCVFPEKWKLSFITPIFKDRKRNEVSNYRGIAILSIIPKRFKLLVYRVLYNDLKKMITSNQHGFMKHWSTVTNLMEYTSFILKSIEQGVQVDSIYTDFSKAFDKMKHLLLLDELAKGTERSNCFWLGSYFSERTQRVKIGNSESRDILVTSGVYHGSHLGPLGFIWFINQIFLTLKVVKFAFYADDLKLFASVAYLEDCARIQSDLNRLTDWCEYKGLPHNIKKCKIISFS
jgi:Reverse transcriptase (RNA-dependent DNA polymerase)